VAWRQSAEFMAKYFHKGSRVVVIGSIQTRNYEDKDGNKRTATEIVVEEIHFGEKKSASGGHEQAPPPSDADAEFFPNAEDDSSLPFDL
jgi:single-strand DNA-binding protein